VVAGDTDSPDCLLILLSISVFSFLLFLFFNFLVFGSVQQIKLTYISFSAHVIIASRIVAQVSDNGHWLDNATG